MLIESKLTKKKRCFLELINLGCKNGNRTAAWFALKGGAEMDNESTALFLGK